MSDYVFARNGMGNYTTGTGMREDMLMQPFNIFNYQAGVVLSTDLAVTQHAAGADMSVDVSAGRCFVANSSYTVNTANTTKYWGVLSDSTANLAVATNTSGSTRIDLVCVKIDTSLAPNDYATNVGSRLIVQGTPGAGQPATPSNHLLLAILTIPTGTTVSITTAMITDSRVFISLDSLGGAGFRTFSTVAWEGASSNPSIGNGSISLQYTEMCELVYINLKITSGTTTTYGTGGWSITLPFNASSTLRSFSLNGEVYFNNGAANIRRIIYGIVEPGTNDLILYYNSSNEPTVVTSTALGTWNPATLGQTIEITGWYKRS